MHKDLLKAKAQLELAVMHRICNNLDLVNTPGISSTLFDPHWLKTVLDACERAHRGGETTLTAAKLTAYSPASIPRKKFADMVGDRGHEAHGFIHLLENLQAKTAMLTLFLVWNDGFAMEAVKHVMSMDSAFSLSPLAGHRGNKFKVVTCQKLRECMATVKGGKWYPSAVVFNYGNAGSILDAAASAAALVDRIFIAPLDEINKNSMSSFLFWLTSRPVMFRSVVLVSKSKINAGDLLYLSWKYNINIVTLEVR